MCPRIYVIYFKPKNECRYERLISCVGAKFDAESAREDNQSMLNTGNYRDDNERYEGGRACFVTSHLSDDSRRLSAYHSPVYHATSLPLLRLLFKIRGTILRGLPPCFAIMGFKPLAQMTPRTSMKKKPPSGGDLFLRRG